MTEVLFLLLRLGLELEQPSNENLNKVSAIIESQWKEIEELAEEQGVSSIVLDGINILGKKYGAKNVFPHMSEDQWQDFLLDWSSLMFYTEQDNAHQIEVLNEMASYWSSKGCRVMVMKGQANGIFYPKPEHRNPGDIDCYLFENYEKGNKTAKEHGAEVDESWYKHFVISYKGETFENHQYFVHTRDGKRGKLLEKELEEALNIDLSSFLPLTSYVIMPPVQWTAMFLTYHACAHFLSEGLRLKQLLDWAMFLNKHQNDIDWQHFYEFCERHHLRRFADAVTVISVDYLGVKITNPEISTTSKNAERILHSVLYDEDYIFSSGESSWQNRLHIIKNLFIYRWKYEEIYQQSIYKQLWWYASGFLFKTE